MQNQLQTINSIQLIVINRVQKAWREKDMPESTKTLDRNRLSEVA